MVNIIILIILASMVLLVLRSSMNHFKGKGGCCGSSGMIEDDKRLSEPEIGSKTISIKGMSCDNCRVRVKNALNRIDGLSAEVDLKSGSARLHFSKEISDSQIKQVIEDAGYSII